jgi:hypothetical protein
MALEKMLAQDGIDIYIDPDRFIDLLFHDLEPDRQTVTVLGISSSAPPAAPEVQSTWNVTHVDSGDPSTHSARTITCPSGKPRLEMVEFTDSRKGKVCYFHEFNARESHATPA